MEKQIYEVTYTEYMKLLTKEERELSIILQAHGVIAIAAHEVMSLNKILKRFYNNECITTDEIVTSLIDSQTASNDKLKILRM